MTTRLLTLTVVLMAGAVSARAQEQGLADLSIKPEVYSESATAYEIFEPVHRLVLHVRLGNEDPDHVLVLRPGFFEGIQWRLDPASNPPTPVSPQPVSLSVEAIDGFSCGPQPPAPCDVRSEIFIPPDGWVSARVVLRPEAGIVTPGAYGLAVDASVARRQLIDTNGSLWKHFLERGSMRLTIRAVRTAKDVAAKNWAEGAAAMAHRDYTAALTYYRRMAAATPEDPGAEAAVGWALLELGRFAEAAVTLERVWAKHRTPFSAAQLAVAYAALGRDDDAAALVRQLYPPGQVHEALARVRLSAKTLKARPR